MDSKDAARVFRAFGDPTRLRILALLARGPVGVGELVRVLRRDESVVSRHLTYLRERGFVKSKQRGPYVVCRLSRPPDVLPRQVLAALLRGLGSLDDIADIRTRAKDASLRP